MFNSKNKAYSTTIKTKIMGIKKWGLSMVTRIILNKIHVIFRGFHEMNDISA